MKAPFLHNNVTKDNGRYFQDNSKHKFKLGKKEQKKSWCGGKKCKQEESGSSWIEWEGNEEDLWMPPLT